VERHLRGFFQESSKFDVASPRPSESQFPRVLAVEECSLLNGVNAIFCHKLPFSYFCLFICFVGVG